MLNSLHYSKVVEQFKKDRRGTRLREATYTAVKRLILSGVLVRDTPLAEERLADILEISRTPVREALAILEHERLIEAVPYKGLFVAEITVTEFLQMYETLELIEPEIARRAAHNATADDIMAMDSVLVEAEDAIPDDVPTHLNRCHEFLRQLCRCAGNDYMAGVLLSIEERSDLYLVSNYPTLPPQKMLAAVNDRRAILHAVHAHDPAAAAEASRAHARAIRQRWSDLYR
jgi:DNA-binding GntR family transcriptional regulator